MAHFVNGTLITSFPISNSEWVTLHILWNSLMTLLPMTNSKWVALHFLWNAVSSHCLFLWPTGSEWHCSFHERQPAPMTNSLWVHCSFCERLSPHLWPTDSEWQFCKRCSHHILFYDQQQVSEIVAPVNGSFILSSSIANSRWATKLCTVVKHSLISAFPVKKQRVSDIAQWLFWFLKHSLITHFPITHRKQVMLHIFWKTVSSYPIYCYIRKWVHTPPFLLCLTLLSSIDCKITFHVTQSQGLMWSWFWFPWCSGEWNWLLRH